MDYIKQNWVVALLVVVIALMLINKDKGNKEFRLVDTGNEQKTISVSGEAERLIAPDTAKVTFSMTRKSKNPQDATDSVNERCE